MQVGRGRDEEGPGGIWAGGVRLKKLIYTFVKMLKKVENGYVGASVVLQGTC